MQRRGTLLDDRQPVWRTLLIFLIPLMLSNVLQSASQTFTSIYLGRMIGVGALAAASSIFPMVFFLVSFFIGVSSGSTVLIGQAHGAGDKERLARSAGTTLSFGLLFGVVIGAVGVVFEGDLLTLLGTPADIFADAETYARVTFATLPVLFLYLTYTTFLRGVGDSRSPFVALIATTLISIGLTPLLITGFAGLPPLGISAAPISSSAASLLGTIGLLIWLERRHNPLALSALWRHLTIDLALLRTLVRIGMPTGIQFVMVSLSEIAVISFVNRFGYRATAAYGAVNQIASYVQFPAISIGIAASIFGAQTIGAQRTDRLVKIVRSAVTLNYLIGGVLIALVYVLDRQILGLFITDETTLEIARGLLSITLWSYVIFGNNSVLSGLMRSSGTVLWPTLISIAAIWGVEVPVAWTLSHGPLGLRGVWTAYPIAYICSLIGQSTYYFFFWRRQPIKALHASPLADAEGVDEIAEPAPTGNIIS